MGSQEGGFLRKLRSVVPGTRENEAIKFAQAGQSASVREEMDRNTAVREAEQGLKKEFASLLKKHEGTITPLVKELTEQGVRKLDIKSVSPEIAQFFADKTSAYFKQYGDRHLVFDIEPIVEAFNHGTQGERISTPSDDTGINSINLVDTADLMQQLHNLCYVDSNGEMHWKTWKDRSEAFGRGGSENVS